MGRDTEGRSDGPKADEDGDLSKRLDRLDQALKRRDVADKAKGQESRFSGSDASGFARAFRLSSEFVAGIVAGGLVGWLFDTMIGSRPWGLIVFLLLGFAAGVMNVMRSAGLSSGPSSGDRT